MSDDSTKDRLVGEVLDGRFRLDRVLGSGGMGKVYGGRQLSVDRAVAVKVLREELSESETLAQRFFREAKVVASLRHSNIVGLVDFGRDADRGLLYIAMEFVDGVSLAKLLRRGRLEPALAATIARQICSALAEAHAAGVVHRDLKPDNVMLVTTAEGALSVKVLDFGIALPSGEEARLTSTGAVVGTPHYMAPEQAQDQPITPRADIYALGVLVYEMLSGQLPFVADTPMAVLLKVITQPPPRLADVLPADELPPDRLLDLLEQMLAKDPEGRPSTVSDVAGELDAITRAAGWEPPRVSTTDDFEALVIPRASDEFVLAETAASPAPTTDPGGAAHRSAADRPPAPRVPDRKRWNWKWALLLVPLLGCCFWCVFVIPQQQPDPDIPPESARDADAAGVDVDPTGETTDQGATAPAPVEDPESAEVPEPIEPPQPPVGERSPTPRRDGENAVEAPAPEVPVGATKVEADGSVLRGPRGNCLTDQHCNYTGSPVSCRESSSCKAHCKGGGCEQICMDQASCEFWCEKGNCTQRCLSNEATCVFHCAGGGCKQACFGECTKSCSGGGCSE